MTLCRFAACWIASRISPCSESVCRRPFREVGWCGRDLQRCGNSQAIFSSRRRLVPCCLPSAWVSPPGSSASQPALHMSGRASRLPPQRLSNASRRPSRAPQRGLRPGPHRRSGPRKSNAGSASRAAGSGSPCKSGMGGSSRAAPSDSHRDRACRRCTPGRTRQALTQPFAFGRGFCGYAGKGPSTEEEWVHRRRRASARLPPHPRPPARTAPSRMVVRRGR